jgi:hypothetical protein
MTLQDRDMCNCIALYDYDPSTVRLKEWFIFMEKWAIEIQQPWESAGLGESIRLMFFKSAKRKLEKADFKNFYRITLLGGVEEPGTNVDWKTTSSLPNKETDCFYRTSYLCFSDYLVPFSKERIRDLLKQLLEFADFKYGICYQRPFQQGPRSYATGAIEYSDKMPVTEYEEDQISSWMFKYSSKHYRTGLLRDIYPFNILVDIHLKEKVGSQTLDQWINSDPMHGTLEKITNTHWLWSIGNEHITKAQETLQDAGLLLSYNP